VTENAEPVVLAAPEEPVAAPVTEASHLAEVIEAVAAHDGPVALDTERASGYRYFGWAYLIQLKTPAGGIHLIDPIALTDRPPADLSALGQVLNPREWILHAASQDLPCLIELGLRPARLFDTELAARLLNRPRVGLAPLVEAVLGRRLLKEHGASDWSTRPLPDTWLNYAALDVALLHELRDRLGAELAEQGKTDWAEQEFQHWIDWATADRPPPEDPWRRTTGIHLVRTARGLALLRELWTTRDRLAREFDLAPGRLLNDQGISDVAALVVDDAAWPKGDLLRQSEYFHRSRTAHFRRLWLDAVARAAAQQPDEWPPLRRPSDGPPSPRSWRQVNPAAAKRWEKVRPAVTRRAGELTVPPENLLQPDALRRLTWEPAGRDAAAVDAQLAALGARAWQRDLVTPTIVAALATVKAPG